MVGLLRHVPPLQVSSRRNTRCTALRPMRGKSIDAALNSSLAHAGEPRRELGCTWTPTDCLMVNATLYVENAMSDAPYVGWASNSLPFTVSAWWSADLGLVVLGRALPEMDSWINQNVTAVGPLAVPRG